MRVITNIFFIFNKRCNNSIKNLFLCYNSNLIRFFQSEIIDKIEKLFESKMLKKLIINISL